MLARLACGDQRRDERAVSITPAAVMDYPCHLPPEQQGWRSPGGETHRCGNTTGTHTARLLFDTIREPLSKPNHRVTIAPGSQSGPRFSGNLPPRIRLSWSWLLVTVAGYVAGIRNDVPATQTCSQSGLSIPGPGVLMARHSSTGAERAPAYAPPDIQRVRHAGNMEIAGD